MKTTHTATPTNYRRSNATFAIGFFVAITGAALPSHAESIAYVHASSQLEQRTEPSHYQPSNLFDDDANTLWCEGQGSGGRGEEVTVHFKSARSVDRIVVVPAQSAYAVTQVRISDGVNTVHIPVGAQTTEENLSKILRGTDFTVTLERTAGSSVSGPRAACLADVLFYHGHETVTVTQGENLTDPLVNRIVGTWAANPLGAPENFLVFSLDGTWNWAHHPMISGTSRSASGSYKVRDGHLLMRRGNSGRFVDVGLHMHHVDVDTQELGAPTSSYETISISDVLGSEFHGSYNNAQF